MNLDRLLIAIAFGVLLTISFYKPQETVKTVYVAEVQHEFVELNYKIPPVKETSQSDENKEPKQETPAYINGDKMIITFSATWCGPCRLLKQEFEKPSLIQFMKDRIKKRLIIDIDNPASNYEKLWLDTIKPSTIPHTIFCVYEDGKWVVMKQFIGFMSEQMIVKNINEL